MPRTRQPTPEFSRLVPRERLGVKSFDKEISATPQERAALARRFDLLDLARLEARLRIEGGAGKDLVRVTGHLSAVATQACVVTLEPVESRIEEDFTLEFSLTAGPAAATGEVVVEPEAVEPPEPVGPEGIDLGDAVAQQLALALDPYPRVPGAKLSEVRDQEAAPEPAPESPFAVLRELKRGD